MSLRLAPALAVLAAFAAVSTLAAACWTGPGHAADQPAPALTADPANGETIFWAGGCASCHITQGQTDAKRLGGGLGIKTPFGTFKAPNISPDPQSGIGNWSEAQFIAAVQRGIGVHGENLYPVFPYTTYQRLKPDDVRDLFAFMRTLPAETRRSEPHDVGFPFNVRLGLTAWKLIYLDGKPFQPQPGQPDAWNRGGYLVEAAAHCAECHSPSGRLGAVDPERRYTGGPNFDKPGDWVPNITQHADGIASWSQAEIATMLKFGETPDGDKVAGSMAEVVGNMAHLSDADRQAMALYIKSLPGKPGKAPPRAP